MMNYGARVIGKTDWRQRVTLTRAIGIFEKVDYEKVLAQWKVLEARGAATMQPEW